MDAETREALEAIPRFTLGVFFSAPKPCEDALLDLGNAYNRLADQVEEARAERDALAERVERAERDAEELARELNRARESEPALVRVLRSSAEAAEAEAARLRGALERIAEGSDYTWGNIARLALSPPTDGEAT